jgi:hypothetical protein
VCGKSFLKKTWNHKHCSKRCARDSEYFIRMYGKNYKLFKLRFIFIKNLNQFRRELKNENQFGRPSKNGCNGNYICA